MGPALESALNAPPPTSPLAWIARQLRIEETEVQTIIPFNSMMSEPGPWMDWRKARTGGKGGSAVSLPPDLPAVA